MVSFDKLKLFFEQIKSAGFWQRLFRWRPIKALSYDAYDEFRRISDQIGELDQLIENQKLRIAELEKNNEIQANRLEDSRVSIQKLEEKIRFLEQDQQRLNKEKTDLSNRIAKYEQSEETRKRHMKKT